ncbi:hypothetical protein ZWY2020_034749 [Hordeum vulgare]|nr:hypothetical protein ZWY2020_034749 [Hordeum vulgare]
MPNSVTGSNGAVQWKTPKLSLPPCTLHVRDGLCKVPASQVEEKELKAYRKIEKEEMNTLLNQYLNFCRVSLKMQAETVVIEKNSLANGIIELIDQNHITKLVMGASSFSVPQSARALLPRPNIMHVTNHRQGPFHSRQGSMASTLGTAEREARLQKAAQGCLK